jgi:hypothetical protein
MRATLLPIILLFTGAHAQQTTINVDKVEGDNVSRHFYVVGGSPVSTAKYVKVVSGSPYFSDKKMLGTIEIYGGKKVDSLWLRLDLIENSVLYTIANKPEMQATSPIEKLTLNDPVSGEHYVFVHSSSFRVIEQTIEPGWYQLLYSDQASLYKKINKVVSEIRPYNSATFEQSINTTSAYLILTKEGLIKIKKIGTIPDVLTDKRDMLKAYLKQNRLNGKGDKDYLEVVKYYNSLLAK